MNLTLVTEAETDIPFLLGLYANARAAELAPVPWTNQQKQQFLESQFMLQRKHYYQFFQEASFDLILLNGIPVGRFYVHRGIELHVMDIIVSPEYQQRGIAKWLFHQLLLEAENANLDISLHVEINNFAKDWYARLGFIEVEDETNGIYMKMLRRAKTSLK
jgi:ribosomal protein S18 acetylase RimI-like enzyme